MNNKKLIDRIKKLLALAGNNPNQAESELAMKRAQKLPSQIALTYLIHNRYGQRIHNEAFKSAWQRAIAKAVKKSGIERFGIAKPVENGSNSFDE